MPDLPAQIYSAMQRTCESRFPDNAIFGAFVMHRTEMGCRWRQ